MTMQPLHGIVVLDFSTLLPGPMATLLLAEAGAEVIKVERPVVRPALIADIAGRASPTVINVLLALQQRAQTGRGCYLDVSMAGNLFPFAYWALGNGHSTARWPGNGTDRVTGGSPRYRLYP